MIGLSDLEDVSDLTREAFSPREHYFEMRNYANKMPLYPLSIVLSWL